MVSADYNSHEIQEEGGEKKDEAVSYLVRWDMQYYINELISSKRFPESQEWDKRNKRSINYFREESWNILEYASQRLSQDPSREALLQCIEYVSNLVWDWFEGRELSAIISIYMFPDAQKAYNAGYNIPTPNSNKLEEMMREKTTLLDKIQTKVSHVEDIENMSIWELRIIDMKLALEEK